MTIPPAARWLAEVAGDAYRGWAVHKAPRMGAALSYYTAFSIGPLLVIGIAVAGLLLGPDAAHGQLAGELEGVFGRDAAAGVQTVVAGASHPGTSVVASILGVVSLIFGASGVFGELHDALNTIWGVGARPRLTWSDQLRVRLLSFAMVASTGFLLLVSLFVSTALSVVGKWLADSLPGGELLWEVVNTLVSLAVVGGVFALVFKLVPDVRIGWRAPLVAGVVTSVLFAVGKIALAAYVAHQRLTTTYGGAGSVVVLLVWVFYASQIVYFGAELSRALTVKWGLAVRPARSAATVHADLART